MLKKIEYNYVLALLKVKESIEEFKKDERGVSGVVVASLLILIGVLAATFLWSKQKNLLETWWTKIETE